MTGTVNDVLARARSQLGYNGGGTPYAPYTKFGSWFGTQTQWCDEFVSWCLYTAGVDPLGRWPLGEMYCPAHVDKFQAAGRWSNSPAPGHVVFYSWDRNGVAEHVGLVEQVLADGSIITIEGNTDDPTMLAYEAGNCVRRKHRTTYYVLGYGIPPYASDESTSTAGAQPVTTPVQEDEMKAYLVRDGIGQYWVVRNDLGSRTQVGSEGDAIHLKNTGNYLPNPGLSNSTMSHIPIAR